MLTKSTVADFYTLLFDAIVSGENPAQEYYFLEHEEIRLFDLCTAIGKTLFERGQVSTAEPSAPSDEEKALYPMVSMKRTLKSRLLD